MPQSPTSPTSRADHRGPRRARRLGFAAALLAGVGLAATGPAGLGLVDVGTGSAATASAAGTRAQLGEESLLYPRTVRLSHSGAANGRIIAIATSFPAGGPAGAVFSSDDGGATFGKISTVPDTVAAGSGLCCTTLYELPTAIGDLPAGTLLWAGAVGQDGGDGRRMSLRVWRSADQGGTWSYLSSIATSPSAGGLWEPELAVDGDGNLSAYYADETRPGRSQVLSQATTTDGIEWSAGRIIVQGPAGGNRPGMPIVEQLPNGAYLMTFEVCGLGAVPNDCEAHWRTSTNGVGWGDVDDLGPTLVTADGRYWTGDPNFAVTPGGRIVGTGQVQRNADGSPAAGNGSTLWSAPVVGTGVGTGLGEVTTVPGPFTVTAEPGVCPNYSSSLLPSTDGDSVLEVATDFGPGGECRAFFGSGALAGG